MFELSTDQLSQIPSDQISDVLRWLNDLESIHNAKPRATLVEQVARARRVSVSSVNQKYYGVKKHGPAFLIDGRSNRRAKLNLYGSKSPLFIEWVGHFFHEVKRNNAAPTVQEAILSRLQQWREDPQNEKLKIPGYETPPLDSEASGYRHPAGWSKRELNRIKPRGFESALGKTGRHKANEFLPSILTTRVGLHVGELFVFDDQQPDINCQWGSKVVRPVGINCMDHFSAADVGQIFRPILRDNDPGEKELTTAETVWLTIDILTFTGYHPERCQLRYESGTSKIPQEMIPRLSAATNDVVQVKICEVSKGTEKGVKTPSKGNPRDKATRESWFNLFRNRTGNLPLQIGWGRDHVPEDTPRVRDEENKLLALYESLPDEGQKHLERLTESLTWSQCMKAFLYITESINKRTDHNIEGWAELEFEKIQMLIGGEWIFDDEFRLLPLDARALHTLRMKKGETVTRMTKLSPHQVFENDRPNLARLSPFLWPKVIPEKFAIRKKIPQNRQIRIDRKKYGDKPVIFNPFYWTEEKVKRPVEPGQEILIFLCPTRPDFAVIANTQGHTMGLICAQVYGTPFDNEARINQLAQRASLETFISGSAASYNQGKADERNARREHNKAELIKGGLDPKKLPQKKGKTKGEKKRQKRKKKQQKAAESKQDSQLQIIDFPAVETPEKTEKKNNEQPPEEFTGLGLFD